MVALLSTNRYIARSAERRLKMTNKEAIEILEDYYSGYFGYKIDDIHEAHHLAIKALEKIDDVKNHKFLSPDNPDYFGKLP